MTNFTPITFAQDKSNSKVVVADRYVPHDLYVLNKTIIEKLGGEIVKGVGGFKAEFKKVADAKAFIKQAVTSVSEDEYKANRKPKTEAKGNAEPPKGNKNSKSKGKGNATPTKANTKEPVKESKKANKGKGNAPALTPEAQKALDRMKMSVLNRAASAYSIANGGEATTFSALGKSADDLKDFIPKAKDGLLKSPKWAKASDAYGLTEDMLG